jgi:heat shock protein HslJ
MDTRVSVLASVALSLSLVFALGCQSTSPTDDATTREAPTMATMAIENITWHLAEVGGKPAEPVPQDARAPHIRLSDSDKRVSGYSSVNQFSGGYELSGQSLKFGMLAMTRRAGPPPLMAQETAFTAALEKTTAWRAAADGIELLDSAGQVLARLKPAK